jgi:carboxyl-terminal processing protease
VVFTIFRGRTVAIIVVVAMIFSSLGTVLVVGDGGLLDQWKAGALFSNDLAQQEADFDAHSDKLKKAFALIKANYVHPVSDEQLIDGAISGMVNSLGDPFSTYMSPQQASQFQEDLKSKFTGIGAEVTMKNGRLTIVSPIKGSPAEKAGLRPEDQVVKVNGQSLEGLDINEAVSKIRGPKGTKAVLDIMRPGVHDLLRIPVVRDEIAMETVDAKMLQDRIGRITINQFSEDTAKEFDKNLTSLEKQGMNGLIIDVRGNPGGILPVVLDILDELVPHHRVVLMTEDRNGNKTKFTSKLDQPKPYPIAVLIDGGSASASEILAAGLKESAGATLIGETSYGKGTVQTTQDFKDGSNIKMTIAKWLTPKGHWVDQHGGSKGIKPDVPVSLPDYAHAIPPQPTKPLKRDDNSADVKNMQMILDALGYNPGRQDGYFDGRTEQAVREFQQTKNLPVTGQLDRQTADQLRSAFIDFLQDPKNDVPLQVAIEWMKKKMK